jgi:Mg/Co/Ni transporter MgtE
MRQLRILRGHQQMEEAKAALQELVAQSAIQPEIAAKTLSGWRAADAVEVLDRLSPEAAAKVLQHLSEETLPHIFDTAGLDSPASLREAPRRTCNSCPKPNASRPPR